MSIYLDYAAATPLDERVLGMMQPYLADQFYNPSAQYRAAWQVRQDLEDARHRIAQLIGGKQHEITVTAGATESINLAINGVIGSYGGEIVTSAIEHLAVIEAARPHAHRMIEVKPTGVIMPDVVKSALTTETTLVSVGYVNNELGTVQSLRDIAAVIESERQRRLAQGETRPLWFHTDASQAMGLLDASVSRLGVDMMTLNAAKCYGPKQVGILWARGDITMQPYIRGGSQESGLRAGTENVAGAIGAAEAFAIASAERKTESHRLMGLRNSLEKRLVDDIEGIVINGHPKKRAPHILHISVPDLDGERAVFALDNHGVQAATGSACAANKGTVSHVLAAAGMAEELMNGSLRFSLGRKTTEADIARAADTIIDIIRQERGR